MATKGKQEGKIEEAPKVTISDDQRFFIQKGAETAAQSTVWAICQTVQGYRDGALVWDATRNGGQGGTKGGTDYQKALAAEGLVINISDLTKIGTVLYRTEDPILSVMGRDALLASATEWVGSHEAPSTLYEKMKAPRKPVEKKAPEGKAPTTVEELAEAVGAALGEIEGADPVELFALMFRKQDDLTRIRIVDRIANIDRRFPPTAEIHRRNAEAAAKKKKA